MTDRPRGVRLRLTAAATAVLFVTLTTAGVAVYHLVSGNINSDLDAQARTVAEAAVAAARAGDLAGAATVGPASDTVIQVVGADGHVIAASHDALGRPTLFHPGRVTRLRLFDVGRLPTDDTADDYRVAADPIGRNGTIIYAAIASDDGLQTLQVLREALGIGLPLMIVVLGAVSYLLVGRALAPVNELLTRLELANDRQRRFVADAAHELRSPLAALRARLEVDTPARELIVDVDRLTALSNALLDLSRLDAGVPLARKPVDLDDVVLDEVIRIRTTSRVQVDATGVSGARVTGDEDALRRVVRNLIDNAVRHAHEHVNVSLTSDTGHVQLTVADDGPGVAESERERIFTAFSRPDAARDRRGGGAGLGLTIVREIVLAHGGSVEVRDGQPGACFVVRLPTPER